MEALSYFCSAKYFEKLKNFLDSAEKVWYIFVG